MPTFPEDHDTMKIAKPVEVLFLLILVSIELSETSLVSEELADVAVVKIGGSSITEKARLETLNATALRWFATTLASHVSDRFRASISSSCSALAIDSSCNRNTTAPPSSDLEFIVVHGAGSFGHHFAKQFGLQGYKTASSAGSRNTHHRRNDSSLTDTDEEIQRNTMQGLARTRQSVQRLNALVVNALIENGINAVALSPCFGPIPILPFSPPAADEGSPTAGALRHAVQLTLRAGIVPVLHGDARLINGEDASEAAILSGDSLMEWIGTANWVSRAVFLTDVDGVYTQDPKSNPEARLVRALVATRDENGTFVTVGNGGQIDASGSKHDHDVTGGLQTKLSAATSIAVTGKNVTIARCGTTTAEQAIRNHQPLDSGTVLYSR